MVYWITGKAGAGKTHYANALAKELRVKGENVVLLDGDDVRKYFPIGYDDEARHEHIMRIAKIAQILEQQNVTSICSLISPKKVWRDEARALFSRSMLVYIPGGKLWENTEYEVPTFEEIYG